MSAVLAVALPVFAVIAAGLVAGRLQLASAEDSAALNRFVFRFAMPAALFGLMSGASGLKTADFLLALAYGVPALFIVLAAYLFGRTILRLDRPSAGAHAFASVIGNAVFLGLPIAIGVENWARPFVVLMLVEGIVIMSVAAALVSAPEKGGARLVETFLRPLKNPLVAAALSGFAVASAGLVLPGPLRSFFDILGRAAGPAALFSLGVFLATRTDLKLARYLPNIASIGFAKMILLPALALPAARLLGVADPDYVGALALFCVVPAAAASFIISSQYGRYVEECAAGIAATTAASIFTIGAALAIFA